MVGNTESPPQVETEVSHTSFPIWRIRRPCDGFSVPYTTLDHAISGLGHYIFSCTEIIYPCIENQKDVLYRVF